MKRLLVLSLLLSALFVGCITNVVEQLTERWAYSNGKGVKSLSFDATGYNKAFNVQGSSADTLVGDATFSLWASNDEQANRIAQNVNLFWSIDTLHDTKILAQAATLDQELVSVDQMNVTVPAKAKVAITTTGNNVIVKGMTGDLNITGTTSDISFVTAGRMTMNTTTGNINGTSGLGGSAESTTGDITLNVTSAGFESIAATATTGNISLRVAGGSGITCHCKTNSGKIYIAYDGTTQTTYSTDYTITVNGGGKNIILTTTTGNISISNY